MMQFISNFVSICTVSSEILSGGGREWWRDGFFGEELLALELDGISDFNELVIEARYRALDEKQVRFGIHLVHLHSQISIPSIPER